MRGKVVGVGVGGADQKLLNSSSVKGHSRSPDDIALPIGHHERP